jgi:hypothetical protein
MLGAEAVRQRDGVEKRRRLQREHVEGEGSQQPCRSSIAQAAPASHPCSVNPLLEAVKRLAWPIVSGGRSDAIEHDFARARPPAAH